MTLKEQITADIKDAMKNKEEVKKNILRVIKAEISREEAGVKELNDEDIIKLMKKNIKSMNEIGDEKSLAEIAVLETYLPAQMTEDQIEAAVAEIIASVGATSMKEMGAVMGQFNGKYAGQADGGLVSKIVKAKLG